MGASTAGRLHLDIAYRDQIIYVFGPFRLDPMRHVLTRDGVRVELAPRLFDTLLYLVSRAGDVVEHDELLRAVWGERVVEPANLKQTIFSLRRALQSGNDDRLIVTAPTRGYLFAAPVSREFPQQTAAPAASRVAGARRILPATAAALAAIIATLAAFALRPSPFKPPPRSVAVMALTNLSGDPAQRYFSDGVSEELIATLSRIGALQVAARSSAFSVRDKDATVAEIGRALNVAAVLEGSVRVRRTASRLRVTVALEDTTTGFTLWSDTYDRDLGDILTIQADIAAAVAKSLRVVLLGGEPAQLTTGGTTVPGAFDAYLRGVMHAETASGAAGSASSLPDFDRAIALDPSFAAAHARRSEALLVIGNTGTVVDLDAVHRRLGEALAEAGRAVDLAPGLGLAHLARGAALMSVQAFREADAEITKAHELAPGDARVTMDFALAQIQFGRVDSGVRAARQAVALDPLTPMPYLNLAQALVLARRYGEAGNALARARILGGAQGASLVERAMALDRGDYASALPSCAAGNAWPDIFCLARAYHGTGRLPEATAQLAKLKALLGDNGAYQYAEIYAEWGDLPQAVRWLQTARRLNDAGLALLKSDPMLAPVRGTSEYRQCIEAMGFPP